MGKKNRTLSTHVIKHEGMGGGEVVKRTHEKPGRHRGEGVGELSKSWGVFDG